MITTRSKDEQYKLFREMLGKDIKTWADLYAHFDDRMAAMRESMHPVAVFDAMYTMYAFISALKDLPEEGDIERILDRMAYIMVYEAKERMGTEIQVATPEDMEQFRQQNASKAASVLAEVVLSGLERAAQEAEQDTQEAMAQKGSNPTTLH